MLTSRSGRRGERGSVLMASMIMLVLLLLAVVVTDRTVANVRSGRLAQDRAAALTATDTAVAEAMARIDRGEAATFAGAGVSGGATFQYRATSVSPLLWSIRVETQSGRAAKAVQLSLGRTIASGWTQSAWREVPTSKYASAIKATSGLIGYYRLDEATGTTTADSSGSGRTGAWDASGITRAVTGSLTTDPSPAARFVSGGVDLGDNFDFTGTSPFTISFWVKTDSTAPDFARVFDKDRQSPSRDGVILSAYSGGSRVVFDRFANGVQSSTSAAVSAGVWTNVVATYDGSSMRLMVGGVLQATQPSGTSISDNNLSARLGRQAASAGSFQVGSLDEVAVWNRALSATEVSALYVLATT